jgi:hypothetical protein
MTKATKSNTTPPLCKRGHVRDEANVLQARGCRACARDRQRLYEAEKRAAKKVRRSRQKRRPLARVEGVVWCDKWGCIHDDSLDPYEMGVDGQCAPRDHFAVYARTEDPR